MAQIEIKHNFVGDVPTSEDRSAHANGTRIKNNSISAEKFNRYEKEIEQIAAFIGDIENDKTIGELITDLQDDITNLDTNYLNPSEISAIHQKGIIYGIRNNLECSIVDQSLRQILIATGSALLDTTIYKNENDQTIELPTPPTKTVNSVENGLIIGNLANITLQHGVSVNYSYNGSSSRKIGCFYTGSQWHLYFYECQIVENGITNPITSTTPSLVAQISGDQNNYIDCNIYYRTTNLTCVVIPSNITPMTSIRVMFVEKVPAFYFVELKEDLSEVVDIEISAVDTIYSATSTPFNYDNPFDVYLQLNRENIDTNTLGLYIIKYNPHLTDKYSIIDIRKYINKNESLPANGTGSKKPLLCKTINNILSGSSSFTEYASVLFEPWTVVEDGATTFGSIGVPNQNEFNNEYPLRIKLITNVGDYTLIPEKYLPISFKTSLSSAILREIAIPAVVSESDDQIIILYVAEDGSTYYDQMFTKLACSRRDDISSGLKYPYMDYSQNTEKGTGVKSGHIQINAVKDYHMGPTVNIINISEPVNGFDETVLTTVEFEGTDTVICQINIDTSINPTYAIKMDEHTSIIPVILDGCFPVTKCGIKILDPKTIQLTLSSSLDDITESNLLMRLQIIKNHPALIRSTSLLDNIFDLPLKGIDTGVENAYYMNVPFFESDIGLTWSLTYVDPNTSDVYAQLEKTNPDIYNFSTLDQLSLCDVDIISVTQSKYIYQEMILPDPVGGMEQFHIEPGTNIEDYIILVSPHTNTNHSSVNDVVVTYNGNAIEFDYSPIGTNCKVYILKIEET